jgi:hypothetical protein
MKAFQAIARLFRPEQIFAALSYADLFEVMTALEQPAEPGKLHRAADVLYRVAARQGESGELELIRKAIDAHQNLATPGAKVNLYVTVETPNAPRRRTRLR